MLNSIQLSGSGGVDVVVVVDVAVVPVADLVTSQATFISFLK